VSFIYPKVLSKQATSTYKLLIQKGEMSAKQIGDALDIFPNSVYRLINHLEQIGLVEQINAYPRKFRARNVEEGWNNFIAYKKRSFDRLVSGINLKEKEGELPSKRFSITFIQGREAVFEQCIKDLSQTQNEAKFIVLGLKIGISPELMLAQKNAVERGVKFREIVQEYIDENREMILNWKKQGLDIRHGQPIGFHLLLFDDKISYIMSYDPLDKTKRYAVRIIHKAINQQLQDIFNKHWKKAKRIKHTLLTRSNSHRK